MSPGETATPEAPPRSALQDSGLLFVLALVSFVVGALVLAGWAFLTFGSDALETEDEMRQRWYFVALGSYLAVQGTALLLSHYALDRGLSAGLEDPLRTRFDQAGFAQRLPLLPLVLFSHRRARVLLNVVVMVLLATLLWLLVNYLGARHDLWRLDLTSERIYTLSEESAQIVRGLEQDIRLVLLIPVGQQQELKQVEALVDQYRDASSRIFLEHYDPIRMPDQELGELLDALGLDRALSQRELVGLVVQAGRKTADGWETVRSKHHALDDLFRDEQDGRGRTKRSFLGERVITAAILEVVEERRRKLYFLEGHDDASITDFDRAGLSSLAQYMRQKNYAIEKLDLQAAPGSQVPEDADLLVVAAPRRALSDAEVAGLGTFLDRGGDALLLLEPWFRPDSSGVGTEFLPHGLETFLGERYGVRVLDRVVYQGIRSRGGIALTPGVITDTFDTHHPIVAPLARHQARLGFSGAAPLAKLPTLKVEAKEIVRTSPAKAQEILASPNPVSQQQDQGKLEYGPFVLAIAIEVVQDNPFPTVEPEDEGPGPPRSRLVVFGDVDWATNQVVTSAQFANLELFLNAANWAMHREKRVVGRAPRPRSYRLEMSPRELDVFKGLALFGFPALAIGLGVLAWVLRARS